MAANHSSPLLEALVKIYESSFPPLIYEDGIISIAKRKVNLFAKQFVENFILSVPDNFSLQSITAVPYNCPKLLLELKMFVKFFFLLKLINIPSWMAYQ